MTDPDRRVATLAVLLAPDRAEALLSRLGTAGAADAAAHARQLAARPRRERLQALAASLAIDGPELRASAAAAASSERPRVATVLRALGADGGFGGAAPVVLRLCRERIGR